MQEKIKFNVIIPTRERADTLLYSLKTIVNQDYDNLSIIVSDNFSQDDTKLVVESFSDSRIKYINTGKRISMSHNWEFALSHVTDGWVTIVGDDDGLLPGALARVEEVIQQTGCKAITSKWCNYNWPNNNLMENNLSIPMTSGIEFRNGKEWLKKLMDGDAVYPDLPFIYTGGFIDMKVIDKAHGPNGSFFLSMTPDVYSAIAIASVLDEYVMLNEPISIAGISSHSNGASQLGITKDEGPAQKFRSEENILFHPALSGGELVKSIPILVYESYLQSVHLHKDFLKVRIEDQLTLALSRSLAEHYDNLKKYCNQIARDNDIDIEEIVLKNKKMIAIPNIKGILNNNLRTLTISGKEFGIKDVYGASLLIKGILLFEMHHKYWRLKSFLRLFKKATKRIFNYLGNR